MYPHPPQTDRTLPAAASFFACPTKKRALLFSPSARAPRRRNRNPPQNTYFLLCTYPVYTTRREERYPELVAACHFVSETVPRARIPFAHALSAPHGGKKDTPNCLLCALRYRNCGARTHPLCTYPVCATLWEERYPKLVAVRRFVTETVPRARILFSHALSVHTAEKKREAFPALSPHTSPQRLKPPRAHPLSLSAPAFTLAHKSPCIMPCGASSFFTFCQTHGVFFFPISNAAPGVKRRRLFPRRQTRAFFLPSRIYWFPRVRKGLLRHRSTRSKRAAPTRQAAVSSAG